MIIDKEIKKRVNYIQKAKVKARNCIISPICGNSFDNPSVDNAISFAGGLKFYPTQKREIRFWKRVLKELLDIKNGVVKI